MRTCIICRWDTDLDDQALRAGTGDHCVCLRCFDRETGSARPMPKELRREITALLSALEV